MTEDVKYTDIRNSQFSDAHKLGIEFNWYQGCGEYVANSSQCYLTLNFIF